MGDVLSHAINKANFCWFVFIEIGIKDTQKRIFDMFGYSDMNWNNITKTLDRQRKFERVIMLYVARPCGVIMMVMRCVFVTKLTLIRFRIILIFHMKMTKFVFLFFAPAFFIMPMGKTFSFIIGM